MKTFWKKFSKCIRTFEFVPNKKMENMKNVFKLPLKHFNMFRKLNVKTFGDVLEQFNLLEQFKIF